MSYNFVENEEATLQSWNDNKIFKESLDKNKNKEKFIFYDGPPFATGSPHYGHILAGAIKDTICRHAQMKGYYVERRAGWDCHGLPIEYEIEKTLGIKNYDEIINFGIKNYNDECRKIVMRCADEWKETIGRFGRWIDFENDYKTMNTSYMESIWWCFKQLWEKNLVYRGFKVMPYSTACGTALSNFEAKSNYKLVNEESIIVKFKDETGNINYLVWTTTPWTLPCNMALCVNSKIEYSHVEYEDNQYILATSLVADVFSNGKKKKVPETLKVISKFMGSELNGKTYKPIFSFYEDVHTYKICCDDYVSDSSGTGIVHIAPAFGEDDFRVCVENKVVEHTGNGIRCPVDRNGCYTNPIIEFIGRNVKDCDKELIEMIKNSDSLFKRLNTSHEYPFCWRSDTPLIYKAVSSWFVSVTKIKDKLIDNNMKTNWVPEYVKMKRFNNWLEDARDWGVSRSRFWGTPIPIWTDGDEFLCIGSISELEKLSGSEPGSIKDLHRESIDSIEVISPNTGNKLRRIEDVFDCWFESGCMPFAYQHYPFSTDLSFPADFIAEGLDQTRGWFYTLLVISTAIKDTFAFKNVIVNGLVLAEDGKKMSKRLKNYPDPKDVINKYGADSLRLYLLSSPVVKAESLRFKESGVADIVKSILIPLSNSHSFYNEHKTKYEMLYNKKFNIEDFVSDNVFDKWIEFKLTKFREDLNTELDNFKLFNTSSLVSNFIENLNNQYIKLNRERMKGKDDKENSESSLSTLGKCLYDLSIILSPILPFFSEHLFNLIKSDTNNSNNVSVHLLDYNSFLIKTVEHLSDFDSMDCLYEIIDLVRILRAKNKISLKMPATDIIICTNDENMEEKLSYLVEHIKNESNVFNLKFNDISEMSKIKITPNKAEIGKSYKSNSKQILSDMSKMTDSELIGYYKKSLGEVSWQENDFKLSKDSFNVERNNMKLESHDSVMNNKNDLLIYLNLEQNSEVVKRYHSTILASNVQKFRKELNLRPWNKISVNFSTDSMIFIDAFNTFRDEIFDVIGHPINLNSSDFTNYDSIDVDFEDEKFIIQIKKEEVSPSLEI